MVVPILNAGWVVTSHQPGNVQPTLDDPSDSLHAGQYFMAFCRLLFFFFRIYFFIKFLQEYRLIQISSDLLSGLNWIQTV